MNYGTKLRRLKVATFAGTNIANLQGFVNAFLAGTAVTAVQSGTVAYPANFVGEKVLVDQEVRFDGTNYVFAIWYAE